MSSWLRVSPVLVGDTLKIQMESTLSTPCTLTRVCLPVCVYFSLKGKEIGSASWERGHVGSVETQGAVCLQLPWASRAWNEIPSCSDYTSSASNCWVCEDSVICHSSEMPLTHHHPALVSTIVLAKVTPFPTSLDFWKSSQFAFYWSLWGLALPFHVYKALPPWHSWLIFLTGIMKSEKVAREAIF